MSNAQHKWISVSYTHLDVYKRQDVLRTENTARALRLLKCKRHAMLVDGNPGFISMIIDAIRLECRRQGYELLVTTCSAADLPEIMRAVHAEPVSYTHLQKQSGIYHFIVCSSYSIPRCIAAVLLRGSSLVEICIFTGAENGY